uniref:Uncharacterized protein n=1 Tax=Cacopsylla melanoneura TaxID=428564 RepID=A0A8D9E6Q2_9HEMI
MRYWCYNVAMLERYITRAITYTVSVTYVGIQKNIDRMRNQPRLPDFNSELCFSSLSFVCCLNRMRERGEYYYYCFAWKVSCCATFVLAISSSSFFRLSSVFSVFHGGEPARAGWRCDLHGDNISGTVSCGYGKLTDRTVEI